MVDKNKAFVPKILKRVTMPTLKILPDVPVYVKILDPIFKGKSQPAKEGSPAKQPPMIFNIINLEDGAAMQMCVNKVVENEILDTYPKEKYVGRCFMILKGKKKGSGDRSYFAFEIAEIEDPNPQAAKSAA